MNRRRAAHILRMDGIEVDQAHLSQSDEDCWVYLDYDTGIQHTVTKVENAITVSHMSFKDVSNQFDDMFAPSSPLSREYAADKLITSLGFCDECLQPRSQCICV